MHFVHFFVTSLLQWYTYHKRDLPWRQTTTPYKVWLSEVILQQTRVNQGLPYYQRFVHAFPTVYHLAKATEEEVMQQWQGLGYYTRARHLHATAKTIVNEYQGAFPTTYSELLKLRGIGPYTAAAIASIAFGESVAAVDGNVYRVLSRVFGITDDISRGKGKKVFSTLAAQLVPRQNPGDYNQALMEFGALQCVPKSPHCLTCPLRTKCVAFKKGIQHQLPVKLRKVKIRKRYLHYIILHDQEKVYVRKRSGKDIWKGLYDFYLIESDNGFSSHQNDPLFTYIQQHHLSLITSPHTHLHLLTHQKLHTRFSTVAVNASFLAGVRELLREKQLMPIPKSTLGTLPTPVLITKFLATNPL